MNKQAIGIFDSGVGGTSIWKELRHLLPFEDTLFLADSKNAPYGDRSSDEIMNLSKKNTEFLLDRGCKIIVVACNTATTNAISYLRKNYPVPFIGIEPAIKPAALKTKTGVVGVLATKGTLSSELFHKTSFLYGNGIEVLEQIGEGLVPMIETGDLHSPALKKLLVSYLNPMIEGNIDHLVLGCTHYPYLIPLIREILPSHITIIDSGTAVARQTKAVLDEKGLLNPRNNHPSYQFYTNANVDILKKFIPDAPEVRADYLAF